MKDFSRFSRDRIEQGKYIEQIFPFMGVRFIAINDHYDSNDYVGVSVRLMLLLKESSMISSVRSSLRRFLPHWMPSVATGNILPPLLLMDM